MLVPVFDTECQSGAASARLGQGHAAVRADDTARRHGYRHRRAAFDHAVEADGAAMEHDQATGDGEAEAGTLDLRLDAGMGALERCENAFQRFGRDTDAAVPDAQAQIAV